MTTDNIDTPESVRELAQRGRLGGGVARAALVRYAELLEHSAGVWVPVGERLPPNEVEVTTAMIIEGKQWLGREAIEDEDGFTRQVTHWLDVRLPGGERDEQ